MSAIHPGRVVDLSSRGAVPVHSERIIRQAGINIDRVKLPQSPTDYTITVVSLNSGEAWHIPADISMLTTMHSTIQRLLDDAAGETFIQKGDGHVH